MAGINGAPDAFAAVGAFYDLMVPAVHRAAIIVVVVTTWSVNDADDRKLPTEPPLLLQISVAACPTCGWPWDYRVFTIIFW